MNHNEIATRIDVAIGHLAAAQHQALHPPVDPTVADLAIDTALQAARVTIASIILKRTLDEADALTDYGRNDPSQPPPTPNPEPAP